MLNKCGIAARINIELGELDHRRVDWVGDSPKFLGVK
jgi:hypothetical protein